MEKLFYLPEAHTDFLMAVIAEEMGFIGVAIVVILFAFLILRAFRIGMQANRLDKGFNALVAQGIGIWFGVQSFINMGVNMGLLPDQGSDPATVVVWWFRYCGQPDCARRTAAHRLGKPATDARVLGMSQVTIMIMAGGTGGHVFPALALADQ